VSTRTSRAGTSLVGILLAQSAFKAARLDCSLPPITALEPIVGIALGIGLLGDTVSVSVGGLAAESSCLLAMVVAIAFAVSWNPFVKSKNIAVATTMMISVSEECTPFL